MVAGFVSKLGDTYSINLRLIDTEGPDAGVKNRASEKCTCHEDELYGTAKVAAALAMGKELPETKEVAATPVKKPSGAPEQEQVKYVWEDSFLEIQVEPVFRWQEYLVARLTFRNKSEIAFRLDKDGKGIGLLRWYKASSWKRDLEARRQCPRKTWNWLSSVSVSSCRQKSSRVVS